VYKTIIGIIVWLMICAAMFAESKQKDQTIFPYQEKRSMAITPCLNIHQFRAKYPDIKYPFDLKWVGECVG